GVQHVVQLTFDNVHFFRDNPNVPSDMEQMPHLLNFIEHNGTMLSDNHTPLIAHTADDSLTNYTGLYGDRHGTGISNSYGYFTPTGTANIAGSFVYWTDPVIDGSTATPSTTDHNPTMIYSAQVPAKAVPSSATGVAAASGQGTIPTTPNPGTWADHTDIRPTMLAVPGLRDDYPTDARVPPENLTA